MLVLLSVDIVCQVSLARLAQWRLFTDCGFGWLGQVGLSCLAFSLRNWICMEVPSTNTYSLAIQVKVPYGTVNTARGRDGFKSSSLKSARR